MVPEISSLDAFCDGAAAGGAGIGDSRSWILKVAIGRMRTGYLSALRRGLMEPLNCRKLFQTIVLLLMMAAFFFNDEIGDRQINQNYDKKIVNLQ